MKKLTILVGIAMAVALALPGGASAVSFSEIKKLTASDTQALERFGRSVAISGDAAIVGAPTVGSAGSAYVFERNQDGTDSWGEVTKLTASDAQDLERFGRSVAISGDTVVVGAWREDAMGTQAGAVYIFQRDEGGPGNWGEVQKLTASDAQAFDEFGRSVAVSGDTAVVGASREDAGGSDAGAAYIFQRNQGGADNWGEVKKLTASDAQAGDLFGRSVAVSGDTAVVGADREDGGTSDVGAAYVFERNEGGAGNWGQVKKLTAFGAQEQDEFGFSVAVSGDTAVVGARDSFRGASPFPEFPVPGPGSAYVFERDEGGADNWGEVKKLAASDGEDGDDFGFSVAVSGDTVVVGAFREDSAAFAAGAAYAFQRDQGGPDSWGEVKKLTASDAQANDHFGISVAVSGDTAVVGAWLEDAGGSDAGAAYVFEAQNTPTGTNVEVAPGSGVTVTFSTVTAAGNTTVTTSTTGPPPPSGFLVFGVYYDINTTASFSGLITVCIAYDDTQVRGNESNLQLRKNNPPFKAITQSVDTTNNIICGKTSSLSIFAIVEPPPDEQININVVDKLSGAKLEGTCWRISYGPARVPHDVVGDTVGGIVKLDCGEPSNLKLLDKDPSPGSLRITITSAQRVQFGDIWHAQMSHAPRGQPLDPNNYECDLSLGKCEIGPVAVGGLAVDLDGDKAGLLLETTGSSGVSTGVLAGLGAAMATALALGGAGWYARRRWVR